MGRRMCGTYLSHQSVRFHVKNCVIGEGETKLGIFKLWYTIFIILCAPGTRMFKKNGDLARSVCVTRHPQLIFISKWLSLYIESFI